jgi:alkanesulfonate monooxygenase SsuD/methylene tetrahydromethanopterin reductase-like flavin-dependent oxidoreductase (luciferase family)
MVPDDEVGNKRELTAPRSTIMDGPAIGVFLPTMSERTGTPGDVAAAARHAEDLGFESVWVVDQLVAGTGVPVVDSTVALAAAAGATSRIRLGYGVMILPLHPVVWAAKQVASLQHVSGGRVLFGAGVGGDRHERSWAAAGVPRRERGRRTDAALAVLPDLIAGRPVVLDGTIDELSPGTPVPPILVGGVADAALVRAVDHADGWFALPVPPEELARMAARLAEVADGRRRPVPTTTASTTVALAGDPSVPDADGLVRLLTDPDGVYGMPADAVLGLLVAGPPTAVGERLAALAAVGVERIVVTLAAGEWHRQADLLAEAVREAGLAG